jgi:adenosylmethionine-8-amino-7-oxononanoate aminotransferase
MEADASRQQVEEDPREQHDRAADPALAAVRARLEAALVERLGNHAHVGEIRGRGLFLAVELVADRAGRTPFEPGLALHERVRDAALARGLACYPMNGTIDGRLGDHAILAPPYIVTEDEVAMIAERFSAAVEEAVESALREAALA